MERYSVLGNSSVVPYAVDTIKYEIMIILLCFLAELAKSSSMSEEDSICLSVLSRSIDSVELQALAEKHNTESSLDLEQSQREALQDVQDQLQDCQSYVDQLELTPDKLQAYLPNLQHQVGRLQRTYHTIQSINPAICEGSIVPTSLKRLTNHLQRLEGRLEVIPEEESMELSEGHDLQRWRENMTSGDTSEIDSEVDYYTDYSSICISN